MLIKYWPRTTKIPFMRYRFFGVALSILMIVGSLDSARDARPEHGC